MKTLTIIVALTFATLTSHAQEASPAPEFDHFIAMRTRAEVRAELKVALANGWHLSRGDATYAPEQQNFVSTLTRAEVRAEVRAAIARGERLSYGQEGSAELPARQAVGMAAQSAIVVR